MLIRSRPYDYTYWHYLNLDYKLGDRYKIFIFLDSSFNTSIYQFTC